MPESKIKTAEDIDKLISAELPNQETEPVLYQLVGNSMLHGPCKIREEEGPCIRDGKCSKYFPKKFRNQIILEWIPPIQKSR